MSLRVVAHGGGVQTTAMLVLAATGRIDYQTFLFANVGDDSEHPGTLRYLREIAQPYAARHGITIHELHRVKRDGTTETLFGRLTKDGSRSLPIPVRMSSGAPGTRSCTADFKIRVLGRWLKANGASAQDKATVAVGISADEIGRINARISMPYEILAYPLVGMTGGEADPGFALGHPLRRDDCERVIRSAGLPVPGKSACWFCPFHRPSAWEDQRRREPELFAKACDLEGMLNRRREVLGKDPVWLTRFNRPLADAIAANQGTLDGMDDDPHCDNGWCMT